MRESDILPDCRLLLADRSLAGINQSEEIGRENCGRRRASAFISTAIVSFPTNSETAALRMPVINERNHLGLQPLRRSRFLLKRGKPGVRVRGQIVTDIQMPLACRASGADSGGSLRADMVTRWLVSFQKERRRLLRLKPFREPTVGSKRSLPMAAEAQDARSACSTGCDGGSSDIPDIIQALSSISARRLTMGTIPSSAGTAVICSASIRA
jgi:hypothetical protein